MPMRRSLRFAVGLVAPLYIGMAAVSADAQPSGGAAKPDDQIAPKVDHAVPNGNVPAAPPTEHGYRGAKEDVVGGHSSHGPKDKGKGSPAKGADTPEIRMKDLGAVDTRITVPPQPRRANDRKQNPLLHSPTGRRLLPPRIRRPSGLANRNAIGETLPPPPQPAARTPSQSGSPAVTNPIITTRSGEAAGNAANGPRNAALAPLRTHSITAEPVAPRSTIDGSSIAHRGNMPAAIGGQAKPFPGINGSAIRPRH